MFQYIPKPCSCFAGKVELDLYIYVTKSDVKDAAGVDASLFAKSIDLANLQSDEDGLDIVNLNTY